MAGFYWVRRFQFGSGAVPFKILQLCAIIFVIHKT